MPNEAVAIIQKVQFGDKSKVHPDTYLEYFRHAGRFHSRKPYKAVEGRQFTLILYDPICKGLTAEVVVETVERSHKEPDFPCANVFLSGSWSEFNPPIRIEFIRTITGLESFGRERAPYRRIDQSQYESLLSKTVQTSDLDSNLVTEGYLSELKYLRHARNRAIVEARKVSDDYTCQACSFRLNVNNRFVVDCHHLIPFQIGEERITSIDELVCLCPTCHRIAHTRRPPLSVDEVRVLLGTHSR